MITVRNTSTNTSSRSAAAALSACPRKPGRSKRSPAYAGLSHAASYLLAFVATSARLAAPSAPPPRFLRGKFMRGTLGVCRLTALACDLALLLLVHRGEPATALPVGIACHTFLMVSLVSLDYTEVAVNAAWTLVEYF